MFLGACALSAAAYATPDYSRRAQAVEPAVQGRLIGRWTNAVDGLIIEISSIDPLSGQIRGKLSPSSGPAAANDHELIGWVSAAPRKEALDNVVPVTFSTTLYEYGTLPVGPGSCAMTSSSPCITWCGRTAATPGITSRLSRRPGRGCPEAAHPGE
jgi:hypothetical protein